MRVVLDSNILVRGNPSARGPARRLLLALGAPEHSLITSVAILQEVARVLTYPRLRKRWRLTPNEEADYLNAVTDLSEVVSPIPGLSLMDQDPDDDVIVATALAGRAQVLCTLDRHFFQSNVTKFCRDHDIEVLTDVALLGKLYSEKQ